MAEFRIVQKEQTVRIVIKMQKRKKNIDVLQNDISVTSGQFPLASIVANRLVSFQPVSVGNGFRIGPHLGGNSHLST